VGMVRPETVLQAHGRPASKMFSARHGLTIIESLLDRSDVERRWLRVSMFAARFSTMHACETGCHCPVHDSLSLSRPSCQYHTRF
jgi:hypothetical protein